jgi:hypothetical protein
MPEVQADYTWVAWLDDGTRVAEREECERVAGEPHGWGCVDPARVRQVDLVPQRAGLPQLSRMIRPGQRAVFFRRHRVLVHTDGAVPRELSRFVVTCIGSEDDAGGRYQFVLPDGRVVDTTDRSYQAPSP